MSTKEAKKQPKKRMHPDLVRYIRDFVLYHVRRRGRQRTAEALGISRQTLWRYLEYDHDGSTVPSAVMRTVGGSIKGLEGEVIAGDAWALVWQQCGYGLGNSPPVSISPDTSLLGIVDWTQRLAEAYPVPSDQPPRPNPDALYRSRLRASMPEPSKQLEPSFSVQLGRGEKDVLDLLAAWPLCTREQLAGLMGGVTRRRVDQVLHSLTSRGLVRADGRLHVLTDDGLTYLARRDRASVSLTLSRWSARTGRRRHKQSKSRNKVYFGTSLRVMASQMEHHAGITDFAAALTAEVARTPGYELLDLMPTSRSSAGYWYMGANYVIHPDASFQLGYMGQWHYYLLEYERRATTPKRVPAKLESYRRYFRSGWASRDHGGTLPRVLFVFESTDSEKAFLDVADTVKGVPIITSNAKTLAKRGILGDSWILPPPHSLDRRPLSAPDPVA